MSAASLPSRRRRLAARREELLARSAVLRGQLATQVQAWQAPLALADQAVQGMHWLRRNPQWPLAGAALVVVLRPRLLLRWAGRGFWVWQLWRRLRPHVRRIEQGLRGR